MSGSIEVYEYNNEKLLELFTRNQNASKEQISKKNLYEYFDKYLESNDIAAKTIVAENDYIDRDFLEDFSAYYVRCFTDYKRKCIRLHFFSNTFHQDKFDSFLEKYDPVFEEVLYDSYLGFIVLKPLPQTIIGRTCLKTYKDTTKSGDKRIFPIIRDYEVNLCGIMLSVESLAFQEQDSVVSACATSALWSAFQVTAKIFQHKSLSPVEITKSAAEHFALEERSFPNKGLTISQMMHAVKELDMEPLRVDVNHNEYVLKSSIYAYLTYGIPIILVIDLYDTNAEEESTYEGRHAVVITGYRVKNNIGQSYPNDTLGLVSSNISRIFVHDDQIGPFAKMKMDGEKIRIKSGDETIETIALKTEWKYRAVPIIILVPLYHKIRIPFENVLDIIVIFNSIIDDSSENLGSELLPGGKIEWDIFLTSVNDLKKEVLSKSGNEGNFKEILKKNMPRFIWRAKAMDKGKLFMDLLFDATDIEQGDFFSCGVVYDRDLFSAIQIILKSDEAVSAPLKEYPAGKSLVDWINNWSGEGN
ncbi:MAG TPA: hypothetical protein VK186_13970 [Candidatus Deferrimicrobium sp.]|nr:hypothetical protein [Candidatus Deferrimicrobium sp.]